MLLHKSVVHDSRVRREAKALAEAGHEVTVLHLAPSGVPDEVRREGYEVASALPHGAFARPLPFASHRLAFLASFVAAARRRHPDVVHAHDAAMLAPGAIVARLTGALLVYDSHELAAGVPYRERLWAWFVSALERTLIRRCDGVITVSDGIADRLHDRYRLSERPAVVRNLPDLELLGGAGGGGLRARLGIGAAPLVLHQGAPAPERGCEQLVRAMSAVPGAQLVFLGDEGDPGYTARLATLARQSSVDDRVHFLPSEPLASLLATTAEADVGVSLLEGASENHRLALPNKVFEYVAAGVPVVVSDLPELRRLVREHGVGWTADPSRAADVARALQEAIGHRGDARLRERLLRAGTSLRWEAERGRLLALYAALASDGERRPQRALVLVRNPCTHDARVLREAKMLVQLGYRTTVVAVTSAAAPERSARIDGVEVVRLAPGAPLSRARRALPVRRRSIGPATGVRPARAGGGRRLRRLLTTADYYRQGLALVRRERPSLVHCNDYNTAWIGVGAKLLARSRMVYDAHELWPDRNLRPEPRPWLLLCEALFVRAADRVLTTSPGYAEVMARRYGIATPSVVRNMPEPPAAAPDGGGPGADARRRAVYLGALTRGRGLEQSIAAVADLPDLELRLVGPDAWGFREHLRELSTRLGVADRVDLPDPVPPGQVWAALAGADVGLALIEPACLSYELTLPNKLFEYTAAGLPILASDLPVIADFVERHGLGLTVDPGDRAGVVSALARVLDREANERFRAAARAAAAELTWASEQERLAQVYENIGGGR